MTKTIANDREHLEGLIENTFKNNITNLNFIDTSAITDMSALFGYREEDFDINQWNVSNVTDMNNMFAEAKIFNSDISHWDVSQVTDMQDIFTNAINFNQDISQWDVSHVTDMTSMFKHAKSFNADIGQWNVSKVAERDDIYWREQPTLNTV